MATGQDASGGGEPSPTVGQSGSDDIVTVKRRLRNEMRPIRRGLADRTARSAAVWRHVWAIPEVAGARRIMGYSDVPGEPEIAAFRSRWLELGREWAEPEAGVEPQWPDVVLVPGLAFTRSGDRLGQGGGWYDRFLTGLRPGCVTVGVGFVEQVLDHLPTEPHDVVLDHVVVDTGPVAP